MVGTWLSTAAASFILLQAQAPTAAPQASTGNMTPDQQFQLAMEGLKRGQQSNMQETIAVLVPFALFAMVAVIIWLKYRQRQAQINTQAEVNKQLLDKFGSGRELTEFLESNGGQRFLETMRLPQEGYFDHALRMVRVGIVMSVVGFGLLAVSWTDRGQRGLYFPAVIVLALGVGFLISAAISQRLSKQWGQKGNTEGSRVP